MTSDISPLVSVIIPAYNAEKFIAATIRSALEQSWQALEVVVVNDGSTDHTADVIRSFGSDPRLRYIEQPNMGCSAAKNTGLKEAKGKFIQYLDADDILSKDKIATQMEVLLTHPSRVAVCKTLTFFESVDEDGMNEVDTAFLYTSSDTFQFLLNLYGEKGRAGMVQPNAYLISRELADAAGPWDISISPSPDEDGEYFCRVLLKAEGISYTGGTNYYRRRLNEKASLSHQKSVRHVEGGLRSLKLKAGHLMRIEDSVKVRKVMAQAYADFIYVYFRDYPQLVAAAETEIVNLGITRIPPVGGKYFKAVSKIIGVKTTLRLRELIR